MSETTSESAKEAIRRTVARLLLEAPENRLEDFDGQAIFDAPVVGVADGDDPIFARFREVVDPRHLLPREVLRRHARGAEPARVRVVAWAMPFTEEVRQSNAEGRWPSRLYSLARNNGGALGLEVGRRLAEWLRGRGWAAVAPTLTEDYDAFRCAGHAFASTWSERHAAYAAGLGRFGLSGALLTPVGSNVRLGSVVTDMPLEPSPREGGHQAPCLADGGRTCGRCIERCPMDAISAQGIDKEKCAAMRTAVRERSLEAYPRQMRMQPAPVVKSGTRTQGFSLGCALCQCGVPCEGRPPLFQDRGAERA